ncbi:hypothetical protein [Duganella sp. BuS-21]
MALSDTFVRQVKPTNSSSSKFADGQGMYLLVNAAGKGVLKNQVQHPLL